MKKSRKKPSVETRMLTFSRKVNVVTLPGNYTIVGGNVIYDMDTGLRVGCITLCSGGKDWSYCTTGEDDECPMLPHLVMVPKKCFGECIH